MAQFKAVRANPVFQSTIEAYVPNRDREGKLIHNHENWVRIVETAVCELTGGACTSYDARGVWRGAYEHCVVVRGTTVGVDYQPLINALGAFAIETKQELAGFTVDGQWYWAVPKTEEDYVPEVGR